VRRILGQFHHTDLTGIEHLIKVLDNPKMLDPSTLTKKQRMALNFISETKDRGIPWKLVMSVVREVLIWGTTGKPTHIEVKLYPKSEEVLKFRNLWDKYSPY